ncbi:PEP/pyruvate-binding domain-containing protein [Eubacteriaceae bacterium ES3]|nr:PEP/pyruvate-binding domain-containing protein [Eubacteriaceae bacterium ES3]
MDKKFSSKALSANLSQTRDTNIIIPERQQWFGELSKEYIGIYNRIHEFLIELNHSYCDKNYVINTLQIICLDDSWIYEKMEESEQAYTFMVKIINQVYSLKLNDQQLEHLIQIHIRFIDRLAGFKKVPLAAINELIILFENNLSDYQIIYLKNSGLLSISFEKVSSFQEFSNQIVQIMKDILLRCINFWEESTKAEQWFETKKDLFIHVDKNKIREIGKPFFNHLKQKCRDANTFSKLKSQWYYNDIANHFRGFSNKFESHHESIYYLIYLLHLPGMIPFKDHLIYDMNRNLRNIFDEPETIDEFSFLDTLFCEFNALIEMHGDMVLDCIKTLGTEIIKTKDSLSINYFVESLIKLGFVYPGRLVLNEDWQILGHFNHVKNIRIWMELIEQDPKVMRELLAALIVNLKLGGIFISDTDLFQRDVTKLLNVNIEPVYRDIKQLARIFPVYFREIGAEGELRDATTEIDELSRRKDRLIHFLRKQIHIESNNTHIELTKRIINYWYDGNREPLKSIIPKDIYKNLDNDGVWYKGVHDAIKKICLRLSLNPNQVLTKNIEYLIANSDKFEADQNMDYRRVFLIFNVYFYLLEKYSLEADDVFKILHPYNLNLVKERDLLKKCFNDNDNYGSIKAIYQIMHRLKTVITEKKASEANENIYYKRHIAADIPSMYGEYVEAKFDALGLTYRLEKFVSKLMRKITQPFKAEYVTVKTFRNIHQILLLFQEGLELDGIVNQGFNSHLDMLKYGLVSPSFSIEQYINLFSFMANDIRQIIQEYFYDLFKKPLNVIIPQISENLDAETKGFKHMQSERFLRDNLATAFLIQDLDNFITDIISSLRHLVLNYSEQSLKSMLTYDPDISFDLLTEKTDNIDNPVFLGAKAFFLKKLISYKFNVPAGFVLTTEVFRHKDIINKHPIIQEDFNAQLSYYLTRIENFTGKKFGCSNNPIFYSIRSGSSISLPGAMKTFLNVGMNDEIALAFSQKSGFEWTAWDCYRRFLQSWGMAFGLNRDIFDDIISENKTKNGIQLKIDFTPLQMKNIAFEYKQVLSDYHIEFENDPFIQLKQAISAVLESWSSESAKSYRNHLQIADDWGTAVIVQQMVMGNQSVNSGTGVVFTSSPFSDEPGVNLYGDFSLCSQGEDVVSGLVSTLPISEAQRNHYKEGTFSLESRFPEIFKQLAEYANRLINQYGYVHQEIEFTFESENPKDLYILQTRNQKIRKKESVSYFIPSPQEMELVGHGIGMSHEVLSGYLAFDLDDINRIRSFKSNRPVILIRPDTVPDDIPLIFSCDGLITAKGGVTSHAAVTAVSIGKVCIVQCRGLIVDDQNNVCRINDFVFRSCEPISIDGNLGNIYRGIYSIGIREE